MLLIIDVHLKQPDLALALCRRALDDDGGISSGARVAIEDRLLRLRWRSYREDQKNSNGARLRSQPKSPASVLMPVPDGLSSLTLTSAVAVERIVGRPLNCRASERSRFFGLNDEVVSAEELGIAISPSLMALSKPSCALRQPCIISESTTGPASMTKVARFIVRQRENLATCC